MIIRTGLNQFHEPITEISSFRYCSKDHKKLWHVWEIASRGLRGMKFNPPLDKWPPFPDAISNDSYEWNIGILIWIGDKPLFKAMMIQLADT